MGLISEKVCEVNKGRRLKSSACGIVRTCDGSRKWKRREYLIESIEVKGRRENANNENLLLRWNQSVVVIVSLSFAWSPYTGRLMTVVEQDWYSAVLIIRHGKFFPVLFLE